MNERKCTFPECTRRLRCKGLCSAHYNKTLKGEELRPLEPRNGPIEERLWPKIDKSAGCWEWNAGKFSSGYGAFKVGDKLKKAHRVVYELEVGPIPDGLYIDHICRNPGCVRPDHLRPVTPKQNSEHRDVSPDNSSPYRGVHWHKGAKKWIAHVKAGNRTYHCGYYTDPAEAHEAVKAKRNEIYTHNNLDRDVPLPSAQTMQSHTEI